MKEKAKQIWEERKTEILVVSSLVIGYCVGSKICELQIANGLSKIYSCNPELEKQMFEQLYKYETEHK